jgi:integrase
LYIEYFLDGERVRKSLGLDDTPENRAKAKKEIIPKWELSLERGIEPASYKISYFTEIVLQDTKAERKPATYRLYLIAIEKFFSLSKDMDVTLVSVRHIDEYVKKLVKEGLSPSSIKAYLTPIKLAFKEAMRQELISRNPVSLAKKPKATKPEKWSLNALQVQTMLREARGELKTFLYFGFFTGARPNEILALRWDDIKDNFISIERTVNVYEGTNLPKTGKKRKIALLSPLKEYISTLDKTDGEIFVTSYNHINKEFKKLIYKLGYKKATPHIMRHTFASLLLKAGENPTLVQWFLGHSSLQQISETYGHYIEDKHDFERIEKHLLAQNLAQN